MGLITLLTAAPNQGKTYTALELVGDRKCVFFVPSAWNKNEKFQEWQWATAEKFAEGQIWWKQTMLDLPPYNNHIRLVMLPGQAEDVLPWFEDEKWAGWVFGFDDFPQLLPNSKDHTAFSSFVAGIRHRDGEIIVTTQRLHGQVPPLVRGMADTIIQLGPLYSTEESDILYRLSDGMDRTSAEFYERISSTPRYGRFYVRNFEESFERGPRREPDDEEEDETEETQED